VSTDELRRLLAEATPLRWYHLIDDYGDTGRLGSLFLTNEAALRDVQTPLASGLSMADAHLIQEAINALPALLDVVEAARLYVTDAWYREGEEVSTTPTRNIIRVRAALDRLGGAS